ncbi:hypothetical protein BH24ACT7_BH24ACT7_25790 [soil metagenome]
MAGRRLSMVERVAIEVGISHGDTDEGIAVLLGRHRSTIWREVDRLVHHADVVSLKGDSYRLKDRDLRSVPTDNTE